MQIWSSTYPIFHWGPIPWSFYLVLAVAFGFMLHVQGCHKQKYSEACRPILGDRVDKLPGKCIDLLALFALLAGTATTFFPGYAADGPGAFQAHRAPVLQMGHHRDPGGHLHPLHLRPGPRHEGDLPAVCCLYVSVFALLAYVLWPGRRDPLHPGDRLLCHRKSGPELL